MNSYMNYQNNQNSCHEPAGYRNNRDSNRSGEYGNGYQYQTGGAVPPPYPGEPRPSYPPHGYGYGGQHPLQRSDSNSMGTAGFVLSLVSLLGFWLPYVGGLTWLLGLIFSIIGMTRPPRGLAIAGFAISLLGLVFAIVAVVFFGLLFVSGDLGRFS